MFKLKHSQVALHTPFVFLPLLSRKKGAIRGFVEPTTFLQHINYVGFRKFMTQKMVNYLVTTIFAASNQNTTVIAVQNFY